MDVFAKRYQDRNTGKAGYFLQCNNFWRDGIYPKKTEKKIKCKDCFHRAWTELKASNIEAHLRGVKEDGSDVIGIYPLYPDGICRFMVFDFDNHSKGAEEVDFANIDDSWKEEVDSLCEICRQNGILTLTERSRSELGAHVWIFFDSPISAMLVR